MYDSYHTSIPKLDLINSRMPFRNVNFKVNDSLEHVPQNKFMKPTHVPSIKLNKQGGHRDSLQKTKYHCGELMNPPLVDAEGNRVEVLPRVIASPLSYSMQKRDLNSFDLHWNQTAKIYHEAVDFGYLQAPQPRSSPPSSPNKYKFSQIERPPLVEIKSHLGPGDYDPHGWEHGRQGITAPSAKFNTIPTDRLSLEECQAPSATSYFKDGLPSPKVLGVIPFSAEKRFVDSNPDYLQWTGATLSCNFDREQSWVDNKIVNIRAQTPHDFSCFIASEREQFDYGVDFIEPDCGNKMTIATSAKTDHQKYSYPFKSSNPVGLAIPVPESGTTGPGSYGGACDKSALEIKFPGKPSSPFLVTRGNLDMEIMGSNYDTIKPRFSRTIQSANDKRVVLNATSSEKVLPVGKSAILGNRSIRLRNGVKKTELKLSHLAMCSQVKMSKIYPTLAKKKFGGVSKLLM